MVVVLHLRGACDPRNFEKIVMAAYRWIVENYQENDRIYLFGTHFSAELSS